MKKQTLLGAAALSTLAIAGAANAQSTLTAAPADGATVTANTIIASEVKLGSANQSGVVGLALTPSETAVLPSGNAKLTFSLTGGATFGTTVTAGAVKTKDLCAPTTTVSAGGGANQSTVTFLVSELNGCDNDNPISVALPLKLNNNTQVVNVTSNLVTEANTAIDGGTATTQTGQSDLISFANAFSATITADTTVTQAELPDFTTLSQNKVLGSATINIENYKLGIQANAGTVDADDLESATFTVGGNVTNVDVFVGGEQVDEDGVLVVEDPETTPYVVTVSEAEDSPIIQGGAYNLSVTLTPTAASLLSGSTFGPSALQSITREGSSYVVPWVASGTLAQASTSNTVVRIANIGSAAVGRVSVELLTSSNGVTTSALVPLASSIGSRGEVVITSASLEQAIGSDFGRGDLRITVEGDPQNLIVRRFVQSTVNGALSEVTLGRTDVGFDGIN